MSEHGRQIMFVVDGGIGEAHMELGTVSDLAERLRCAHYSDAYEVTEVYGLSQLNEVKALRWTATGGDTFDEDHWAHVTVTVEFPDRGREQGYYRIDGRA